MDALASCERIDECKDWADKAEALATYAKMADDDSLRMLADRIQSRAVGRMGELLKQFNAQGKRTDTLSGVTSPKLSRQEAGHRAGLSDDQIKQAVRVANVPRDTFETLVESDNPADGHRPRRNGQAGAASARGFQVSDASDQRANMSNSACD